MKKKLITLTRIGITAVILVSLAVMGIGNIALAELPSANSDIVEAAGYLDIVSGSPGSPSGDQDGLFVLANNCINKIRQNGVIDHFQINVDDLTNLTNFYITIWRRNDDGTFDGIWEEDILSQLTGGTDNVTPSANWTVQVGDYIGYGFRASPATNQVYTSTNLVTANSAYYVLGTANKPGLDDYDWTSESATTSINVVKVYMQAPQIVWLGASNMVGYPYSRTGVENAIIAETDNDTIPYQFNLLAGNFTYQNMAIISEETPDLVARFQADVIDLKPRLVVISNANDINHHTGDVPDVSLEQYISDYTDMLDLCVSNNITAIVTGIPSFDNLSNTLMQYGDNYTAALAALVAANYTDFRMAYPQNYVGEFRAGGDPGNLWDIPDVYDSGDGTHKNEAGLARYAQMYADIAFGLFGDVETSNPTGTTVNSTNGVGNVTDNIGGIIIERGFQYGVGSFTDSVNETGVWGTGNFTLEISGLSSDTEYMIRAYATSNATETVYGSSVNFTTLGESTSPTVTTSAASDLACDSVTGNGNITSIGSANVTYRGFHYGIGEYSANVSESGNWGTGVFDLSITGLTAATEYQYRAFAQNEVGISYGDSVNFTTSASSDPTFTTSAATSITTTTAQINGTISDLDCAQADNTYWQLGTATGVYDVANYTDTTNRNNGAVSYPLTSLTANTTYYFRGGADISGGSVQWGSELSFTTSEASTITSENLFTTIPMLILFGSWGFSAMLIYVGIRATKHETKEGILYIVLGFVLIIVGFMASTLVIQTLSG